MVDMPRGRGGFGQDRMRHQGYILEFHQVGSYVKVSAFDPVTLTEVSTMGPANLSQAELGRLAIRKLEFVLARQNADSAGGTPGERK
ncbi:DUF6898 family protein [Dongia mobilis]|nr:hypothetical protein [Dongia mobilis]